jgi:hypothetical protein
MKIKIYKTVLLPVERHGSETWSLTLREESKLRLFEFKIQREIFVSKTRYKWGVEKASK